MDIASLLVAFLLSAQKDDLAERLRELETRVLSPVDGASPDPAKMLAQDARRSLQAANERESAAWRRIRTREDWERYREEKLRALRESLGSFPALPTPLGVVVTRTFEGDGYRVENLVFESRPGLKVTANLYWPLRSASSLPGILLCHSHHNPKSEGELQDMGVLWARAGCAVLVMDQLGHGERRQHPFRAAADYPQAFRVGRQDYYFRYNEGLQLQLLGESLMGFMVNDLCRGVDLLLERPEIDKARIILLGSVAGGGDPAAVAGALDPRIAAVVPFNFGGPQPETEYPLPQEAQARFNYAGSGSWESTRNLRLSARDGFLPWVIVASIAPRRLIYGHEFSWDQERDPVWSRLTAVYGFYEKPENLASTTGRGLLSGKPPEASHCNNIGPIHRQGIYAALARWFGIPVPEKEPRDRHTPEELACLTREIRMAPLSELAAKWGEERTAQAHRKLEALGPRERREWLRAEWSRLLGDVEPDREAHLKEGRSEAFLGVQVERRTLQSGSLPIPLLLLVPEAPGRRPCVAAISQEGKAAFLKNRAKSVAELLRGGVAVCLADLRGTGETRPGAGLDRQSAMTSISSSELMLGRTLVGLRVKDLRAVIRHLRGDPRLDASRLGLWGDSLAPALPPDRRVAAPLDAPDLPESSHPMGEIVSVLAALFEEDVKALYARGGLASYRSVLESPFVYLPQDAVVPGAIPTGDLPEVVGALSPRPVRLDDRVDGQNRLRSDTPPAESLSQWIQAHLN
jgi:dienelactone hydrolase